MADRVSVDLIVNAITKGFEGAAQKIGGMRLNMTELNSALSIASRVYQQVDQALQATLGTHVAYAQQVRTLTQLTGASSEEASRFIQIGDDLKVNYQELETALAMAAKRGVQPTIEGLADLSDRFLAIEDPVERAKFGTDNLGRGWVNLLPILTKGGQGIRNMGESIQENLILTDRAVQAAREYEIAQDNLADAVEGVKVSIGGQLVPVVTDLANRVNVAIEVERRYNEAMAETNVWFPRTSEKGRELLETITNQVEAEMAAEDAIRRVNAAGLDALDPMERRALGTQELTDATEVSNTIFDQALGMLRDSNVSLQTRLQLERELALATGKVTKEDLKRERQLKFVTRQLELQNITLEEYLQLLQDIQSGHFRFPSPGRGGGTGAGGPGAGEVGIGPEGGGPAPESEVEIGGMLQGGGLLGDSALIGEGGTELAIRTAGGQVLILPADVTRRLMARGVQVRKRMQGGGVIMDGGGEAPVDWGESENFAGEPGGNPDIGWSPSGGGTDGGGGGGGGGRRRRRVTVGGRAGVAAATVQAVVQAAVLPVAAASQALEGEIAALRASTADQARAVQEGNQKLSLILDQLVAQGVPSDYGRQYAIANQQAEAR